MDTFEDSYAKYLELLARLDRTDDIAEKNQLFRQLTRLLCDLEQQLKSKEGAGVPAAGRDELAYWL